MEQSPTTPLCVDLDGTLVTTNTLFEAVLGAIREHPWVIAKIAASFLKGKANVKHTIGLYAPHDVSSLPYNKYFLAWLQQQHANGRTLILATASDSGIANAIAQELGIFSEVIANTPQTPVSANGKCKVLCERFGTKQFAYAGNSHADISVWECAMSAILVDTAPHVTATVRTMLPIEAEFLTKEKLSIKTVLKTIRVHQWAKNLLIFTAPIAAYQITTPIIAIQSCIAFVSFSFLASSVYIANDLLDIPSDRKHATKRFRPIASGKISISGAVGLGVSMATVSALLSIVFLPINFIAILVLYLTITTLYSLRIKKIRYVDIVVLAGLYVVRIIAGSMATHIPTSRWLFVFAGCLFLSLAIAKRVAELTRLAPNETKAIGRGYLKSDKQVLTIAGISSALLACIVLSFYTASASVVELYSQPKTLLFMIPIFGLWILRMWHHALTGASPEDPVLYATKDYVSYLAIIALTGVLLVAR